MKKSWLAVILVGLLLALLLPFLRLQAFGDEYEHALAGWFFLNHLVPYTNYFSHHAPLPLFLGILGYLVPGNPILVLRIWVLVFYALVWWQLLKFTRRDFWPVLVVVMIMMAVATPTFLFQMALANVLVNMGLLMMLVLLLHYHLYQQPQATSVLKYFAVCNIVCFWSSVAAAPALLGLDILLLVSLQLKKTWPTVKHLSHLAILAIGTFLVFPSYYLITGSWHRFFWSVFTYNTNYYFPLRLAANEAELQWGPFYRIAHQFLLFLYQNISLFVHATLTLVQAVWGGRVLLFNGWQQLTTYVSVIFNQYWSTVAGVRTAMAMGLLIIWLSLMSRKQWVLVGAGFLLAMSFFFRDNELFHLAPLFLAIVLGLSFLYTVNLKAKNKILMYLSGGALIYLLMTILPTWQQVLKTQPPDVSVKNLQDVALLKQISKPNDQMMVLDGNMVYYPLAARLPACHYHYYLPWLHQTAQIQTELRQCLISQQAQFLIIPDQNSAEVQALWPLIADHYRAVATGSSIFRLR